MGKWYEVTVQAWQVIVVEVADNEGEDEAMDAALDESAFTFVEDKEITKTKLLITPEMIEQAKRHANEVSPLPSDE